MLASETGTKENKRIITVFFIKLSLTLSAAQLRKKTNTFKLSFRVAYYEFDSRIFSKFLIFPISRLQRKFFFAILWPKVRRKKRKCGIFGSGVNLYELWTVQVFSSLGA